MEEEVELIRSTWTVVDTTLHSQTFPSVVKVKFSSLLRSLQPYNPQLSALTRNFPQLNVIFTSQG